MLLLRLKKKGKQNLTELKNNLICSLHVTMFLCVRKSLCSTSRPVVIACSVSA